MLPECEFNVISKDFKKFFNFVHVCYKKHASREVCLKRKITFKDKFYSVHLYSSFIRSGAVTKLKLI